MKKFLFMLLAAFLLLSGCTTEQNESSDTSSVEEVKITDQALALIEEEKFYNAYKLLYDNRSDAEAQKMLDDFTVVYTEGKARSYYTYNHTQIEEFNEHGDVTRQFLGTVYVGYDYVLDCSFEYTYDDDGKKLTCNRTEAGKDIPDVMTRYIYDERGNLIKEEKEYIPASETETDDFISYVEYKYDENDRLIYEESVSSPDGIDYYYRYTYDENGRKKTETFYNTENNKYDKEFFYNDNGIVIKEVETRKSHTKTTEYTVNEHGDITKETQIIDYEGKKTSTEYTYEYTYDENGKITQKYKVWPNQESDTTEYIYNEQGDVIKETYSSSVNSTKISEYEYEYNADGEKVKITKTINEYRESKALYEYDSHGSKIYEASADIERRYEYTYDELGRVATMLQDFDTKQMFEYTYDEKGNEIKRVSYSTNAPDIKNTIERIFDENGNVVKTTESKDNGRYVYITTQTYDERGNILTNFKVGENSEVETDRVHSYVYDDDGKIIEETTGTRGAESGNRYVYEYDERGNNVKRELYFGDELDSTIIRSYDDDDNVIKMVIDYAKEGKVSSVYEYEYDECGNLIYELRQNEQYSSNTMATVYEFSNYEYYYTPNK